MCAAFSHMNNINFSRVSEEDARNVIEYGTRRFDLCMRLYRIQVRNGLYFLHEHPAGARSWENEDVRKVLKLTGVATVTGDMCQFGMEQETDEGLMAVRKRTQFMTHAPEVAGGLGGCARASTSTSG